MIWAALLGCNGAETDVADVPAVAGGTTFDVANRPPVANDDDLTTFAFMSVEADLTANDDEPDKSDSLEVVEVGEPSDGTVEITSKRKVEYTPNDDFDGTDSFTYVVADESGATSEATVIVEVLPPPTLLITGPPDGTEVDGSGFDVTFEVDGCDVSAPSENASGCHLHAYIDGTGLESQGHYDPSPWTMDTAVVGPIEVELRLILNDGSDAAFDPYIHDFVDLVALAAPTGTDPSTGGSGGTGGVGGTGGSGGTGGTGGTAGTDGTTPTHTGHTGDTGATVTDDTGGVVDDTGTMTATTGG